MYNDYYLQEISGKITTTNNNLNTILQNQTTIIQNQNTIITTITSINGIIGAILLAVVLKVIWDFIIRCWK